MFLLADPKENFKVLIILKNRFNAIQSASFRNRGVPVSCCCVLVTNSLQNTLNYEQPRKKTPCTPLTSRSCALSTQLESQVAIWAGRHFGQPGTPGTFGCRGKITKKVSISSSISLTHLGLDSLLDTKLQTYKQFSPPFPPSA